MPTMPLLPPLLRKSSKAGPVRPEFCLNCGFRVEHTYCPICGQENTPSRVTFAALVRDGWDDLVKIDSKLIKTLIPLLLRPGFLTQEYNAGKRARYLSPFKMYLVISAFFFLLVSWRSGQQIEKIGENDLSRTVQINQKDKQGVPEAAPSPPKPQDGSPLRVSTAQSADKTKAIDLPGWPDTVKAYRAKQESLPPRRRDSPSKRFAREKLIALNQPGAKQALAEALIGYIPNLMFFLLPLFALLLKIVYLRSGRLYVEHLVYALHLHSVFFLLASLEVGINNSPPLLMQSLAVAMLVYGFLALRRVYGQSPGKTFFKGVLLMFNYFLLLVLGFIATILCAIALM